MAEQDSRADLGVGPGQPEREQITRVDPPLSYQEEASPPTCGLEVEAQECTGCRSACVQALPCGHRLCAACIQLCRVEVGPDGCSICYGSQLMDSVLQSLLEVLFQGRPRMPGVLAMGGAWRGRDMIEQELCTQHGEPLTVFCLDEDQPICQDCTRDMHNEHPCCSLQEAVLDCKRELRSAMRTLQDQLDTLTSVRDTWQDTAAHIKSQAECTSQALKEQFEKMHQYLRDEEVAAISALKEDEEEKSQRLGEKTDRVNAEITALSGALRETEEAVALDECQFLKKYKRASQRAQCRMERPEEELGALLNVAKHQGSLQYSVWEKMQNIIQYFPVTLDPNTASACLSVSTDLTSVSACEEQHLPNNADRFGRMSPGVLGSEGFDAGRHGWEVEVGDNSCWSLGMARENVRRKDQSPVDSDRSSSQCLGGDPENGPWTVSLSSGEYWASPGPSVPLRLRRRPCIVKIQLDWERGCLTFSEAGDNSLIYRFKRQWSGMLRPYLSTACSKHPLRIRAGKVTISVE